MTRASVPARAVVGDVRQQEVAMERDDSGAVDWDAAFEAIVAPLRPSRASRLARTTVQAVVAGVLFAAAWFLLLHLMVSQMHALGRPWR